MTNKKQVYYIQNIEDWVGILGNLKETASGDSATDDNVTLLGPSRLVIAPTTESLTLDVPMVNRSGVGVDSLVIGLGQSFEFIMYENHIEVWEEVLGREEDPEILVKAQADGLYEGTYTIINNTASLTLQLTPIDPSNETYEGRIIKVVDVSPGVTTQAIGDIYTVSNGVLYKIVDYTGYVTQGDLNSEASTRSTNDTNISNTLSGHISNFSNPHNVTATQIGALPLNMDRYVNAKLSGAVGDGIIDDTVAIKATVAEAKATGKGVYLPRGSYKITDTSFLLDWADPIIVGAGTDPVYGSHILTTSNTLPVISVPGDYNGVVLYNFTITGLGRTNSTTPAITLRGDLVGGSNIDFLLIDKIKITGFMVGVDAVGIANSSIDRIAVENCTTCLQFSGNTNSVTVKNSAFVTVGGAVDSVGVNLLSGCNGVVITSCDMGGSGMEWCVKNAGQGTTIVGGQWEAYHSGFWSTSVKPITVLGLTVRQFGTPSNTRWSARLNEGTLIGNDLSVRNSTTNASIRCDTTISRGLHALGHGGLIADFYTTNGTFDGTYGIAQTPVSTDASGEGASANNHGALWRRLNVGSDEILNMSVKNSSDTYEWANLLSYHWDKKTNGDAAYITNNNTFTGNVQRITNSSNPGFSITTVPYTNGKDSSGLFRVTSAGSIASGTTVGDVCLVAEAGRDLVEATSPDNATNPTVRRKITRLGYIVELNTPEYDTDALAAADTNLPSGGTYKLTGSTIKREKP